EQGRADAVAADVEQVDRQVLLVDPVVAEHVPGQVRRGNELPVDGDWAAQRGGKKRLHVAGGAVHLGGQLPLLLGQLAVRLVAFQQVDVPAGVVAHPGDHLQFVRQLDEVVVGP